MDSAWHRSVYGRIALGMMLLLVVEFVAQGSVFLWLVARRAASNPPDLTVALATQLSQKIEADPERPQFVLTETGIGYRLRAPD